MENKPVNILFDLDIAGDCTNVGALATLHALTDMGEANILATTACYHSPYIAACVDAVNRYYGRGDLPVGTLHRQPPTEHCIYTEGLSKKFENAYPPDTPSEDTVNVQRRILAAQPDQSLIFVITGCLASAAALVDSEPDDVSPLSGRELIIKKIQKTIVMGGNFPTFDGNIGAEFNIGAQIPAAQHVCEVWPGELIFTGGEIGCRIHSLAGFPETGDPESPVRYAYEQVALFHKREKGSYFPSWDATAVLQAVRPDRGYFELHPYGKITVDDKGRTIWSPCENGKHSYFCPKMPLDDVGKIITELVMQTPKCRR